MLTAEDLVGVEFTGSFQRNAGAVRIFREHREKVKRESPEMVEEFDAMYECGDGEDAFHNKETEFGIQIHHFDPATGLFLASGKDRWGTSGILGTITGGDVKFRKIYIGDVLEPFDKFSGRFEEVDYEGHIVKPDDTITMGGDYGFNSSRITPELNERFGGKWRLDSKAPAKSYPR